MHNHAEGGSDLSVSLDAFKITRPGVGGEHGDDGRWQVTALYSWSQELLIRHANALPPTDHPIWIHGNSHRIIGARFARRNEAVDFLRDLERTVSV